MTNLIYAYVFFLLKILTITILILIIISVIIIIHTKVKSIELININKKYNILRKNLYIDIDKKKIKDLTLENKILKKIKKNLIILNFSGDMYASEIENLKDIISLIILNKTSIDEVVLKLTSGGGLVSNYGLAASHLKRLTDAQINLTISIDTIAASGGYMMACVAKKIIASNFAIIGSIGVLAIVPNINKLLNKHNIDIEYHTSGEFKNTLSILGKNTDTGRKKFIESLENTHILFKNFIKEHRPQVDISNLSTGEYWYGQDAIKFQLIDEILTSDEYIISKLNDTNIYEIKLKENLKNKIRTTIKTNVINFLS